MFDIQMGEDGEVYDSIFQLVLLEAIPGLLSIIAYVLLLVAATKLVRHGNIPGARAILISLVVSLVLTFIYVFYAFLFELESSYYFDAIIDILLGIIFLFGAYGFIVLVKFVISKSDTNMNSDSASPEKRLFNEEKE